MRVFILASFALMGLAYWALSGGASFRAEAPAEAQAAPEPEAPVEAPVEAAADAAAAPEPPAGVVLAQATPEDVAAPEVATRADAADELAALPAEPLPPGEALAAIAPELAQPVEEAVAAALATPADEATPEAALASVQAAAGGERRLVTGDRVNMREGPGTGFAVVGQLAAGEEAVVLEAADGWARVRAGGAEGWMSERFLGPAG